ncbi:MAG: hypothetical protein JNG90_00295 [Planctomycetaceae bacterium]|nr:hypothetical protein [Planctomycetaceae bacterium]
MPSLKWLVDWQNIAALGVVLLAVLYVARQAWLKLARRAAPGCGSCGSCAAAEKPQETQVIGVETLLSSVRK